MNTRNRHRDEPRPPARPTGFDKVRAPYGFVHLSPRVVLPEWGAAASRDLPFEDGICGSFRLGIEAVSPIFVRGTRDPGLPFQLPDGTYGLPGTAVRGMLRNVVEIATFGKLSRVNAHRYTLRDLHNHKSYVSQMARIEGGQPIPLVNAGWLVPAGDGEAVIHPCHFAKLEYAKLRDIAAQAWGVKGFDPGRKQSAVDKYRRVLGDRRRLPPVRLALQRIPRPIRGLRSEYGVVTGPGDVLCHVVMTGQPAPYVPNRPKGRGSGNPKHHDFVFHGRAGPPIPVSEPQLADFEFGHSARGQQNNLGRSVLPNEEWGFWKERVWTRPPEDFEGRPERGVPVFFLLNERGELRAMGLAMMFRLAGSQSVWQAVQRVQPDATATAPDFAETLFGTVPDERRGAPEGAFALAGRVSFGVARALGAVEPGPEVGPVVLGTPKASYYPNYVEQRASPGQPPPRDAKGKPDWKTWVEPDAVPRGWKRYRPIAGHQVVDPPRPKGADGRPLDLSNVGTTFRPLPAGTRFELDVRLHNVREVELGALLWALDFGGAEGAFHKLGLARSLGYGTVRLPASGWKLSRNDGAPVDPGRCIEAFRQWMDDAWHRLGGDGPWEGSRAIRELVALARPMPLEDARHMQLDHPVFRNEFQRAKLEGLALAPPTTEGPVLPRSRAAGAGPAPGSVAKPASGALPPLPRAGERVRVRLTGQNRKGRWQAELLGIPGSGTLIRGEPPEELRVGTEHEVVVVRASSRNAIELGWG